VSEDAQLCDACHKAVAKIHVTDVQSGKAVQQRHFCKACAASGGMLQGTPMKLSPEVLDDLFSGLKGGEPSSRRPKDTLACVGCGMTLAEFRMRGRMGCPRCYLVFKAALVPLLDRVHDGNSHRGRFPGRAPAAAVQPDLVADLKRRLADAIHGQAYEDAARLRDELRKVEGTPRPTKEE
jgi:protein arginine kinase activator